MRLPLVALLLLAPALAGCLGSPDGAVTREQLAFDVVSSVGGVKPAPNGDVNVTGTDGVLVTAEGGNLRVGLAAVTQTQVVQACRAECRNLTVPPGTVVAESHLASLRNLSLNAVGPDADSAILFFDQGQEGGRFLRWSDAAGKFQMNADVQALGNVTGTGHVGTTTPLVLPTGAIVTVSTAAAESGEVTVFARGSSRLVNGTVTLNLPPAFVALATGDITAQVTLTSAGPALYVADKTRERITVRAADASPSNATFDWFVQAARKGGEEFRA